MKILTVDVGTGTQDIFLYDSRLDLENGLKLVVPSPTMIVHRRLKQATHIRQPVLLTGVTMGGGPSGWAAEDHIRAGLALYATSEAARSFNDDLDAVQAMGVVLVSDDEARRLPADVLRLELRDFDFDAIARSLEPFGVSLGDLAAVAVAVFDHGNSPPDYSDRQFRFDYLDRRIRAENRLSAFAYRADEAPEIMTRLQAVVQSAKQSVHTALGEIPLVVMDTAPAAVLGATFDSQVQARERVLIANVGNFHTLAFRLGPGGIEGVFEHHTGLLDLPKLEALLRALAAGSLTHAEVFGDNGHGALIYHDQPLLLDEGAGFGVVVTGPRRGLMRGSTLRPYFAVPFGDMMIAGCFGLLAAVADVLPELGEPIRGSLSGAGGGTAPWDA
ncbi:MAG: hypothetical protein A2W35_20580 [Chloroflexi bacterium RBG_16_57_11]|nr:MAG: hypothetical protein A2W35_20580 [Chloroflexi bacterium RBG_16_57_11]